MRGRTGHSWGRVLVFTSGVVEAPTPEPNHEKGQLGQCYKVPKQQGYQVATLAWPRYLDAWDNKMHDSPG